MSGSLFLAGGFSFPRFGTDRLRYLSGEREKLSLFLFVKVAAFFFFFDENAQESVLPLSGNGGDCLFFRNRPLDLLPLEAVAAQSDLFSFPFLREETREKSPSGDSPLS